LFINERITVRHHNIETETVVRVAVKLICVAYSRLYDRFYAVHQSINQSKHISIAPYVASESE